MARWIHESWRMEPIKTISMNRVAAGKPMCVCLSHLTDFTKQIFEKIRHDQECECI